MEYRRLGRSGLKLSAFSFGSWVTFHNQVDTRSAEKMMALAYDQGVNFFDNAEVYAGGESEVIMGQALRDLNWRRDSYCVSSKVFWGGDLPTQKGLHRKHIFDACHAALRRLQVDYLDLYFCHRPDPETPIEETVRAMNDLIQQGKVMYWGTSEWTAEQLTEAALIANHLGLIGPTMEQPEYNLLHRHKVEIEFLPIYEKFGLGTTIWSPLASGKLTGKYNDGVPAGSRASLDNFAWIKREIESENGKEQISRVRKLATISSELGVSLTHLSLAWCLKCPYVTTVILGASRIEQLEENLKAIETVEKLTPEVMRSIDEIFTREISL